MRNANPKIVPLIIKKTLSLLIKSNPDQIGMREIARECGVTATLLYHYYRDKTELFQAVGLDCILRLNKKILGAAEKEKNPKKRVVAAAKAFRDWCFKNPRQAILVMQGIKSVEKAPAEVIEQYYACNRSCERLLKEAVQAGLARSSNVALDVGILVSGLWGCCEAVILKKADPKYWKNGNEFADRFLQMWIENIFIK